MPCNEEVSRVNGWFDHFGKGIGVFQNARDIFEDCNGDLEEQCEQDNKVPQIAVFAVSASPCARTTPVRAGKASDEDSGIMR